jgi:hypothetical protein
LSEHLTPLKCQSLRHGDGSHSSGLRDNYVNWLVLSPVDLTILIALTSTRLVGLMVLWRLFDQPQLILVLVICLSLSNELLGHLGGIENELRQLSGLAWTSIACHKYECVCEDLLQNLLLELANWKWQPELLNLFPRHPTNYFKLSI